MYQSHQQDKQAERQLRESVGELTAAALLTALADWLVALWMPDSVSVVGAIIGALGDAASVIVLVTLLCAGVMLKWAWFTDIPPDEIYYPPLDRELRDKERKAKPAY